VNSIRPKQYIHNTGNLVTQKFKKKLAEGCEYDYERGGTILVLSLTELKASPGPFGDMMQFQFLIPVMWPVSECLVHDRCDLQITMIPLGMIVISSQPCWPTSNPTSTLPSSDIAIAGHPSLPWSLPLSTILLVGAKYPSFCQREGTCGIFFKDTVRRLHT
jgi:hypothetical protein